MANENLFAKSMMSVAKNEIIMHLRVMSSMQRATFILLVLLNVFVPIMFLLLPCDHNSTCSVFRESIWVHANKVVTKRKTVNWNITFEGVEVISPIILLKKLGDIVLLFVTRAALFQPLLLTQLNDTNDVGGGIFIQNGLSGKLMWKKPYGNPPIDIYCNVTGVNKDDIDECLFVSADASILPFNSTTGIRIWKSTRSNFTDNTSFVREFPVVLPDLDGDGTHDIAIINDGSKLEVFSGKGGLRLRIFENKNCSFMHNLNKLSNYEYVYDCVSSEGKVTNERINMTEILEVFDTVVTDTLVPQYQWNPLENVYSINGYSLHIEVRGNHCPIDCNITLYITENNVKMLWKATSNRTAVTRPIVFNFRKYFYGFILKFWVIPQINAYNNTLYGLHNLKIYEAEERIVAIVFKSYPKPYPIQALNISCDRFIMVCDTDDKCQPNIHAHRDSLMVIDVDKDGYQDLITYYSTFEPSSGDFAPISKIVSTVKIINIEDIINETWKKKQKANSIVYISNSTAFTPQIIYI